MKTFTKADITEGLTRAALAESVCIPAEEHTKLLEHHLAAIELNEEMFDALNALLFASSPLSKSPESISKAVNQAFVVITKAREKRDDTAY